MDYVRQSWLPPSDRLRAPEAQRPERERDLEIFAYWPGN